MKTCPARVKLLALLLRPRTVAKQSHLSDLSTACQGTPQRGARKKHTKNHQKSSSISIDPRKMPGIWNPKNSPTHPKKVHLFFTTSRLPQLLPITDLEVLSPTSPFPTRIRHLDAGILKPKNSTKMEETFEAGGSLRVPRRWFKNESPHQYQLF